MSTKNDDDLFEGGASDATEESGVTGEGFNDADGSQNNEEPDLFEQYESAQEEFLDGAKKKGKKKINKVYLLMIVAVGAVVLAAMAGAVLTDAESKVTREGSASVKGAPVRINTDVQKNVTTDENSRLAKAAEAKEKERLDEALNDESGKSALRAIQEVNQTQYALVEEPTNEIVTPAEPYEPSLRSLSPEQRAAQIERLFSPMNGTPLPFASNPKGSGDTLLIKAASIDLDKGFEFRTTDTKSKEYELVDGGSPGASSASVNTRGNSEASNQSSPSGVPQTDVPLNAEIEPVHGIKTNYGYQFYGTTRVEINSDEPSFVWADSFNGKYRGARFFAEKAQFNGEHVRLVFNKMVYKGKTYDVNVIALDPESQRSALVDDIDTHPEKWFYFTLAKLGENFLNAVSTTTSINSATGAATTVEGVDEGKVYQATAAGTLGAFTPSAEQYLQIQNTIRVYDGREVIFFMAHDLEI